MRDNWMHADYGTLVFLYSSLLYLRIHLLLLVHSHAFDHPTPTSFSQLQLLSSSVTSNDGSDYTHRVPKVEEQFCSGFNCCGLELDDLVRCLSPLLITSLSLSLCSLSHPPLDWIGQWRDIWIGLEGAVYTWRKYITDTLFCFASFLLFLSPFCKNSPCQPRLTSTLQITPLMA